MERNKLITLLLIIYVFSGCRKDELDLYKRPNWLAGKVYTQLKTQPELSTFARCMVLTGYDKIVDVSGSYTVFAPTNEAFSAYLTQHSYNSVEDIPLSELSRIVRYMIVQNPWNKRQLQSLDVYGWIDTLDLNNNKARGFKRQTLLLDNDYFFGVRYDTDGKVIIIDSTQTNWHRRAINDTRKYAPLFFKDYYSIYSLKTSDNEFYFERPIDNINDIYFVNSKILGDEIFAENGFIYAVDRVVEPLKNAYQILSDKSGPHTYIEFLNLIEQFPQFLYNQQKTLKQPDAALGLEVDSLFELTYPQLAFNITSEDTKAPAGTLGLPNNVTIRYHHGLIAPTDNAFTNFVNTYLVGPNHWGSLKSAPENIKRMIVNTYLSYDAIYPSDFVSGYKNGESDIQVVDPSTVVQKQFASNSTFIGVNEAIPPRAFKAVTGPVYLQRGYSTTMNAVENTGLLSALKRQNEDYMFFVESDNRLFIDSSLIYNPAKKSFAAYILNSEGGAEGEKVALTITDVRTLLLNHIGMEQPVGLAKKEFIKTMSGNYLVVNNESGEISGTAPTKNGFNGDVVPPEIPVQISNSADNGITYQINNWFQFASISLFSNISVNFPEFQQLLISAGLVNVKEYRYNFLQENVSYTVFAPSGNALLNFRTDTLTTQQLKDFCMMHFISGKLIFTDGKLKSGYYATARIDEKSTSNIKVYTQLFISPGIDKISFHDKSGSDYLSIPESPSVNRIASITLGDPNIPQQIPILKTNGVIHKIDKVLLFNELDTQ